MVPPAWVVWLFAGVILSAFVPYLGWAYGASLLLYVSVILAGSAWLGRGKPRAVALRIPAVLVGVHFGFAWGFLREVGRRARYH
jgi:hypothetical protein